MRKPVLHGGGGGTAATPRRSTSSKLARIEAAVCANGLTHLVLGVYLLVTASVWWFGAYKEFHFGHGVNGEPIWQRWPISVARGFGYTLNLHVQFVFLVACRKLLTALRSTPISVLLPFDKAMPAFHMVVGYAIAVSATIHAIFHLIAGLTPGEKRIGWMPGFGGWTHAAVTGFALYTVLATMVVTSLPAVRHKYFERFYRVHLLGAAIFFCLFVFHGLLEGHLYSYKWVIAPVALYVMDRGLRWAQTHKGVVSLRPDDPAAMRMVSPSIARLALPRVFTWSPGQYAELRVPSLSRTEWHPFTIASAPHEEHMVFFVKGGGNWTSGLCDAVREAAAAAASGASVGAAAAAATHIEVHVRGPFGAPAQHTGQYSRVLLIAGGVGVTPFLAVAKDADRLIRSNREADPRVSTTRRRSMDSSAAGGRGDSLRRVSIGGGEDVTVHEVGKSFAYEDDVALTDGDSWAAATARGERRIPTSSSASTELDSDPEADAESEWSVVDDGSPADEADAAANAAAADAMYGGFTSRHVSIAAFLRSVTASYVAMWLLLARIGLLALASTVHHVSMGSSPGLTPYDRTGLIVADLVFAALFAAPVAASIGLEAAAAASSLSLATAADDVALAATAAAGVILPALALGGVAADVTMPMGYLYALVLLPATLLAFGWRHFHLLTAQLLVAPARRGDVARLRAVDFLWTAPTAADDGWVVDEVAAIGDTVRLHRFGTRESAPPPVEEKAAASSLSGWDGGADASADVEAGLGGLDAVAGAGDAAAAKARPSAAAARPSLDGRSSIGSTGGGRRLSLNYGRPGWEAVLSTLVAHSRSGSVVGVFICGPVAMSDAVRDAARKAMRESRVRGRLPPTGGGGGSTMAATCG
ncbi:hypothetical protein BU14_0346s0019 [Porphyra umbilicalis]|uniref:FAD-binding FR-type domain-containing protein n=1 Tax=Porphyra umbilicalis TaxID=2786 RepID=A0A1X6NY18_PORUM|nr:hypothetical protein BU14_0346s0019 [Porphyra umbilicalis]|eukprot:OSX73467.1 hypothetical protein BU14_0346s0019 [Porphyra umbilicalis]